MVVHPRVSLGYLLRSGSAGSERTHIFSSLDKTKLFSKQIAPFYPPSNTWNLPISLCGQAFKLLPVWGVWNCILFNFGFLWLLMLYHIFICLLAIPVSFSRNLLFLFFPHFYRCTFLLITCDYTLWLLIFCWLYVMQISFPRLPPSLPSSFPPSYSIFLIVFFDVHKMFYILIWSVYQSFP